MRKLLLIAVGALVIGSGCATQDAWKVRTADHWPVQTWESGYAFASSTRCRTPMRIVRRLWNPGYCCDQALALNSVGPRAQYCNGTHDHDPNIARDEPPPIGNPPVQHSPAYTHARTQSASIATSVRR
jgi:hypothetical protein